jgi:carbon storage regulator
MLVLTRKLMERIYIGEEICVTVVRLESGQVRLGIDAPRHIPVVRGELSPRARAAAAPAAEPAAPGDFRSPPTAPRGADSRPPAPSR